MDELKTITVVVEESKENNGRYVLKATPVDGDKALSFSFFKDKQDGTHSKAYDQFMEIKPMPGDALTFAIDLT